MNHKRRRPKHQRSGCILCKPWKDERTSRPGPVAAERALQEGIPYVELGFSEGVWSWDEPEEEL